MYETIAPPTNTQKSYNPGQICDATLCSGLQVGNTGKLEFSLVENGPVLGTDALRWADCAILAHGLAIIGDQGLRPVRCAASLLEGSLLALKVLNRGSRYRSKAGVNGHASLVSFGCAVHVRQTAVPHHKVPRVEIDLLELEAFVLKPLDASLLVSVPLVCPLPESLLLGESLVILHEYVVSSRHDYEYSVLISGGF